MMQTSLWRFFPWTIAAGMAVVIAVNIGMVTAALHTFPGKANGGEGFDLSNRYNAVIDRVRAENALGWSAVAQVDQGQRPVLTLRDGTNKPLNGARITATAERPVGDPRTTEVMFRETTPGLYTADRTLLGHGQWDLMFTASANGHDLTATRRIVVK